MSDQHGKNGARSTAMDTAALEGDITRIRDVQSVRVMLGPQQRVSEIHVLAEAGRAPKQIVRDVQSVLLASHGLEVDYRTISVVQLKTSDGLDTSTRGAGQRIVVTAVQSQSSNGLAEVGVELTVGGEPKKGSARGLAAAAEELLPAATLDALGGMVRGAPVKIESVATVQAVEPVVVCILRLITSRGDHTVAGAAVVRQGRADAVVRATLDALNRLLSDE